MEQESPANKDLLTEIEGRFKQSEEASRADRDRWARLYGLYRSYQRFKQGWANNPRDRDEVFRTGRRQFGAELFIPYSYATVETILPRMLSNRPRMLVLPRDRASEDNVENIKAIIDAQQDRIHYELRAQDVVKDALMYGLGVQKTCWRTEKRAQKYLKPPLIPRSDGPQYVEATGEKIVFDGPDSKAVDIFDFFWDSYGDDIATCEWAIHRTWASEQHCLARVSQGVWTLPEGDPLELIRRGNSRQKFEEAWADRWTAAGASGTASESAPIHEVWEYHSKTTCITVLDRYWVVQQGENPYWHGELPFQIYRPTKVPHEFVGIGEIEPIEHLQYEINALRSQRRDNAAIVLSPPIFYQDGTLDPSEIVAGPGMYNPVIGDPRDSLWQQQINDIPNSGYQEENTLQGDIERATGISDAVAGADIGSGEASSTATGVQMVQAAASIRIQNKTRRAEAELIGPTCQQWVSLNQQHITENVEFRGAPIAEAEWTWHEVSPPELLGDFEIIPEGGATAPDNIPQQRQDAQIALQMFGGRPDIDQPQLIRYVLKNMGVKDPDAWIVEPPPMPVGPDGQPLPPEGAPPSEDQQQEPPQAQLPPEVLDQIKKASEKPSKRRVTVKRDDRGAITAYEEEHLNGHR